MATYEVLTWDTDSQEFTPQVGAPHFVHGVAGLRRALRYLESIGYEVRGRAEAFSVSVERIADDPAEPLPQWMNQQV